MGASKSFGEDCGPWALYLAPLYSRIYGDSSVCKATVVLRIFTTLNRGYIVSRPLAIMMLCYSLWLIEVYPFWPAFCHCSVLKNVIELKRVIALKIPCLCLACSLVNVKGKGQIGHFFVFLETSLITTRDSRYGVDCKTVIFFFSQNRFSSG